MPYADREKQRTAQREWDQKNQKRKIEDKRLRRRALRARFAVFKKTLKCSRCPESHFACLDFHHRDPNEKDMALFQVISVGGWSWEHIMREVAKCEVLCANCHRKEHYVEDGED
jgi:hypothetical protein